MTEAPETPTEVSLADIWSEVLQTPVDDRRTNFFESGGDSLLAAIACISVLHRLGVELTPTMMFAHPVLADIAHEVDTRAVGPVTPGRESAPRTS